MRAACFARRSGWLALGAMAIALFPRVSEGAAGITYLGPRPSSNLQRLVTLAPSLTDLVIELGAADRLVGVSRFDEQPQVRALPRVGGFVDPSVEAVVALEPDLVLVPPSPGNKKPVEAIAALHIPVLVLPLDSIASVQRAMREVGNLLGRPAQGEALAARLTEARQRARARSQGRPKLRVMFAYDFQPLVVAGPGSFAHELLGDVGAVNISEAGGPFAVFSLEKALAAKPDVVVDASDGSWGADKLRRLPGLKEARWVKLRSKDLMQPGPRLERGVEELLELLHPQVSTR